MLSEILVLLLVLAVAALMAVDLVRTRSESAHGHAERPAHGAEQVIAVPVGSGARMFSPEPARGMPAVFAPVAGPSPRETEAPRAFDQVPREMSRPAAGEAELRDKFNTVFVNLSHRSQSLVERQLRLIEDLEHG